MSDISKTSLEREANELSAFETSRRNQAARHSKRDKQLTAKYERIADAYRDAADYIRSRSE